jgi:4-hydroxy 2-oxovalerate aldolase
MELKRFKLLDCTLRDGGFANNFDFGNENIRLITKNLSKAHIDIIELGFLEFDTQKGKDFSIFPDFDTPMCFIPESRIKNQLFSAMIADYDNFPIDKIPNRSESSFDIIRVMLRYSDLGKSLKYCKQIAEKGYKLCIQPAITMRYSRDELNLVFNTANEVAAYALYIVDSYGYMTESEVADYFALFDKNLSDSICIGFHAHNNMNIAFSNSIAFINYESTRNILIDSSLFGMGQGAGNLPTELFVDYLNKNKFFAYKYKYILEACEIVEEFWGQLSWGYSVVDLISAINRTSYKYSRELRNKYSMSFVDIYRVLNNIPEEMRHRYTPENTKLLASLLKNLNKDIKE